MVQDTSVNGSLLLGDAQDGLVSRSTVCPDDYLWNHMSGFLRRRLDLCVYEIRQ